MRHFVLSNQDELDKLSQNPNYEISEILPIGEILQVGVRPISNLTSPSMNSQVVTGAYVTGNQFQFVPFMNIYVTLHISAYARIEMDKAFRRNLSDNAHLLYTDTDSAMIKIKKDAPLDLKFGSGYREWKDELPQNALMKHYCALGPKSYAYTYEVEGSVSTAVKCKGFSLRRSKNISHFDMKSMVEARKKGKMLTQTVPQFNLRIEKKTRNIYNSFFYQTLSSDILKKCVLIPNYSATMPYGYSKSMLKKYSM